MERHKAFIVGRVLDYGTWQDWKIIRDHYGLERLKNISLGLRGMLPQPLSFIATVIDTAENHFKCYENWRHKKGFYRHPFSITAFYPAGNA